MTIVKELNGLAEKMTGENPNKKTINETLDFIADYLTNNNNNEKVISKNIKIIADNYQTGGGGADISEYLGNVIPPQTDEGSDYVSGDAKWLIKKLPDNLTLGTGINNLYNCFSYFYSLESIPLFDTSNVEDMSGMCHCCYSLVNVPLFNTSKVISLTNAFSECQSLSNGSLNNILAMCTNTPNNYDGDKCLESLGLSQEQITICHGLSNYQAFLNAGWRDNY